MGATAALTVLLAGSTSTSANAQSDAIKQQSAFEAQQLSNNAALADIQAADIIKQGKEEARAKKRETRLKIGSQRAALAAQGYDLEDDEALAIQEDTAAFGAYDEETIRNNAWRQAWGYKVEAQNSRSQSEFTRITGKSRARSTLLTGGINAIGQVGYGYQLSKLGS